MTLYFNIIGLLLDIFGVVILFLFGLPPSINKKGHINLILEQADDNEIAKASRYEKISYFGLTLILLGFLFQLFSNLIQL
jgi:hypothetical protein